MFRRNITPVADAFAKSVKENNWLKPLGTSAVNSYFAEVEKKRQELETL